jgi:ankyrin repeat protein
MHIKPNAISLLLWIGLLLLLPVGCSGVKSGPLPKKKSPSTDSGKDTLTPEEQAARKHIQDAMRTVKTDLLANCGHSSVQGVQEDVSRITNAPTSSELNRKTGLLHQTMLHRAAALPLAHREDVVSRVLSLGAKATAQDGEGNTPLHCLLKDPKPDRPTLDAIAKAAPELWTITNDAGETPLHVALQHCGDEGILAEVVRKTPPLLLTSQDKKCNTPLHHALKADKNKADLVIKELKTHNLIKKTLEIVNNEGEAPLHTAIRYCEEEAMILELISLTSPGMCVFKRDWDYHSYTPLQLAIIGSKPITLNIIKALIARNKEVLMDKRHIRIPMYLALTKDDPIISSEILMELAPKDQNGYINSLGVSIAMCSSPDPQFVLQVLDNISDAKTLLDQDNDSAQYTPLHDFLWGCFSKKSDSLIAIISKYLELAPTVLQLKDEDGRNPLDLARIKSHGRRLDVIALLEKKTKEGLSKKKQ